jgi:hypothetical protein
MSKTVNEVISQERVQELKQMAAGYYGSICFITENPYEVATVVVMIHLMLWLSAKQEGADTKAMLEDYCKNFMDNYEMNEGTMQ